MTAETHATAIAAAPVPRHPAPGRAFRTDIQALRTIAVMAVVLNHLSPTWLTGGYVGVDVFFVISGFLISSHLDREIARTGRVRLARFYARRIRRLLPAAFLVLGVSLVAAYFLLPYDRWETNAHEALAGALYAENWLLAINSVDYSAFTSVASLAQHYWSLSVEEQFYLLWPLLLVLLFKTGRRTAQVVGIGAVGVASLAFCVYFTEVSQSQAYFVTPARVWEFAIGALVAFGGSRLALPRVAAEAAAFAGLVMIVGSAVLFDHDTAFPGFLALVPTAGTALVIIAGAGGGRQWHTPVSASTPFQFLGATSYSLYLWHWPLIVLAPFAFGGTLDEGRLTLVHRLVILVVAVVLAWLSKVLVEDRGMAWAPLAGSTRNTFVAMVAGIAAVGLVAGTLTWTYERHVAQAARDLREQVLTACHGAAALFPERHCEDPFGPARIPHLGPANAPWGAGAEWCADVDRHLAGGRKTTSVCDFSGGAADPTVVWLVGDSHGEQWQAPLLDLARERKWVVNMSLLGGCPFARIPFVGYRGAESPEIVKRCTDWVAEVAADITETAPDTVFMSFYARRQLAGDTSGRTQTEYYRDGLEPYWRQWTDAGAKVVVLGDPPLNHEVRAPDCVGTNPGNPAVCAVDRDRAQPADPLAEAARSTGNTGVTYVDMTDYFCDARKCYGVVGGVVVYFDANHLNREFSRTLRPVIAEALGIAPR
ncbi:acyltransferase family protein [Saccharothrix australiensis]|uniref:Peptidoglycan/LPS O-acetylase OafA/YrhL n=1 Tax=Saccharothrix australiensis TaxID=2072 RepID=A0A495VWV9_9PSEU|nr:acyltransferase family protein [Saccharothrix australiensis]RKT53340.1 peptidoglycan/LPS O-acetylase OafA/YrhL [Saccharothrix australiensis]